MSCFKHYVDLLGNDAEKLQYEFYENLLFITEFIVHQFWNFYKQLLTSGPELKTPMTLIWSDVSKIIHGVSLGNWKLVIAVAGKRISKLTLFISMDIFCTLLFRVGQWSLHTLIVKKEHSKGQQDLMLQKETKSY